MSSNRSTSRNKRKVNNASNFVSHNDTCLSLKLPPHLTCQICDSKSCILSKKRKKSNKNFRTTSKRYRCEQRWTEDYVSIVNASQIRLQTHYDTCIEVGIEPKVNCINRKFQYKNDKIPKNDCKSKSAEYSIIDLIDEGQIKIRVKKISNSRKSIIEESNYISKYKDKTTNNYEVNGKSITLSKNLKSNTSKLDMLCQIAADEINDSRTLFREQSKTISTPQTDLKTNL